MSSLKKIAALLLAGTVAFSGVMVAHADDPQVDNSTESAAAAFTTVDVFKSSGANQRDAEILSKQADMFIKQYVSERLEALRERYGQEFEAEKPDFMSAATAEEVDKLYNQLWSQSADDRHTEINKRIDDATTLDEINAIVVTANVDAHKSNIRIAESTIADLPDSPAKREVLESIQKLRDFYTNYEEDAVNKGLPKTLKDIPVGYRASAALNDAMKLVRRKSGELGIQKINNALVASAKSARATSVDNNAFPGPAVYKNEIVKKAFTDWFTQSHPFYLMDTLAHVVPQLDVFMAELDESRATADKNIDAMANLDDAKKKEYKEKIAQATSAEEVAAILELASKEKSIVDVAKPMNGDKPMKKKLATTGADMSVVAIAVAILSCLGSGIVLSLRKARV